MRAPKSLSSKFLQAKQGVGVHRNKAIHTTPHSRRRKRFPIPKLGSLNVSAPWITSDISTRHGIQFLTVGYLSKDVQQATCRVINLEVVREADKGCLTHLLSFEGLRGLPTSK